MLGRLYSSLGDLGKGEDWSTRALEIDHDDYDSLRALAWIHAIQGWPEQAASLSEPLSHLRPDSPSSWADAGAVALWVGDESKARERLEKAEQLASGGSQAGFPASTVLGYLLWKSGERTQAEKLLASSVRFDQEGMEAGDEKWRPRLDLARVFAVRGNKDKAYLRLQEAIDAGFMGTARA